MALRDANANGHFIYSVKSTHIYCRPTCPGRLARRANVGFHATWMEAEAAGFRACKRCKPNTTGVVEDVRERAVKKACVLIEEALEKGGRRDASALRLRVLAGKVKLTPRYFHGMFKAQMGVTPREYARRAVERSKACAAVSTTTTTATTASVPTMTAEASAPSWEEESMDPSNLNDLGFDSSLISMDEFAIVQDQPWTVDPDLAFNATGLFQPWTAGYEPAQNDTWQLAHDSHISDSLQTTSLGTVYYEKAVPSMSALELNAAALLNYDSPDLLQLQSP